MHNALLISMHNYNYNYDYTCIIHPSHIIQVVISYTIRKLDFLNFVYIAKSQQFCQQCMFTN